MLKSQLISQSNSHTWKLRLTKFFTKVSLSFESRKTKIELLLYFLTDKNNKGYPWSCRTSDILEYISLPHVHKLFIEFQDIRENSSKYAFYLEMYVLIFQARVQIFLSNNVMQSQL